MKKTKNAAKQKSKPTTRKPKVVKKKLDQVQLPANVTRSFTLGLVIRQDVLAGKKSVGREDLVKRADEIYSKAHGKAANPKEANWSSNQAIGSMAGLGLIEFSTDTVFFKDSLIKAVKS